jgi:hypothetical protein
MREEILALLHQGDRLLEWQPESEAMMDYRGLTYEEREKPRAQLQKYKEFQEKAEALKDEHPLLAQAAELLRFPLPLMVEEGYALGASEPEKRDSKRRLDAILHLKTALFIASRFEYQARR